MLSPFLFPFVVDVVTELARDSLLGELLYFDYFLLVIETTERLRNKFRKWTRAYES